LCLTAVVCAQTNPAQLTIQRPSSATNWIRLASSLVSNSVLTLEASTNLTAWREIGTFHDAAWDYPDVASTALPQRFYLARSAARGADDDWKNQILYPVDSFGLIGLRASGWIKFVILLEDPTRVYYQPTEKYPFHFDFVTRRLPPFVGLDAAGFEAIALHRTNQQIVLGTVLYPPATGVFGPQYTEYGVQFVGLDAYTPEEIARWFELVRATIYSPSPVTAYYMPTFEQAATAVSSAAAFAARGIPVASVDRWTTVNAAYSSGWAFGRLKYFPATEVVAAFGDGRLGPEDILLTDGVPANTPIVAGILSLVPVTPSSHTALLARSLGVPFAYLPDANDRAQAQQLAGRLVVLRVAQGYGIAGVKLLDVDGALDSAVAAELRALKEPRPIQFLPKRPYGAISASTDALLPADIQYFGGKAANYGLLRRTVPSNCPPAIAFSFDLWDAFLEQTLPGGRTLRAEIAARLASYTNFPPDIVSLKTNLAGLRDLRSIPTAGFASAAPRTSRTRNIFSARDSTTVSAAVCRTIRTTTPPDRASAILTSRTSAAFSEPSKRCSRAFTTTMRSWSVCAMVWMRTKWRWACWCIIRSRTRRSWPTAWRRRSSPLAIHDGSVATWSLSLARCRSPILMALRFPRWWVFLASSTPKRRKQPAWL
jgi:hypothetical protein